MEVHVTGELEAKLTHSAAKQGRDPDEFVQDVLAQYFDEEARFVAAVKRGDASLRRGEYLTHEEVGERLKRFLQPS
jgi:predicted transcriptional regulator